MSDICIASTELASDVDGPSHLFLGIVDVGLKWDDVFEFGKQPLDLVGHSPFVLVVELLHEFLEDWGILVVDVGLVLQSSRGIDLLASEDIGTTPCIDFSVESCGVVGKVVDHNDIAVVVHATSGGDGKKGVPLHYVGFGYEFFYALHFEVAFLILYLREECVPSGLADFALLRKVVCAGRSVDGFLIILHCTFDNLTMHVNHEFLRFKNTVTVRID